MPRQVSNPPLRFAQANLERDDDAPIESAELEVSDERARSILSRNDSPDLGFRWSINPYRGCFHACAYCYARPSHAYLGLGSGTDFDRRIVAKVNAPELLREAFGRPSWQGETILFSGNTDCYQPIEARYELTRRLLEVCREHRNPVAVITKSTLVRRDVDLLAELARTARCTVTVSCAFSDDDDARAVEPNAAPPSKRFATMRMLADAGIPVGVSLAPTIPGLNDAQIPSVLERAREAGATYAFHALLRLPLEVVDVFGERMSEAYPLRVAKILSGVRQMRDGKLYQPGFGERMRGSGERWQVLEQLFRLHARRLGFQEHDFADERSATPFVRPTAQLSLFDR